MTPNVRIAGLSVFVLLEAVFVIWQGMNSESVKAQEEAVVAAAPEFNRDLDARRRQDVPDTMKITMTKCEVVLPMPAEVQPCVR